MGNDDNKSKNAHLYYHHRDAKEFDNWCTRFIALAGKSNCKRMLLKQEHDDPKVRAKYASDKKSVEDEMDASNEVVWDLLVQYLKHEQLLATLTRLFADNINMKYDGHGAYKYIEAHWKDCTTFHGVEDRKKNYDIEVQKNLPEWTDKEEAANAFDRMGMLRDDLNNTKREIDDIDFCRDMFSKFSVCNTDVFNSVREAWKELGAKDQECPLKVQKALSDAAGEATGRERARDAARPGRAMAARKADDEEAPMSRAEVAAMVEEATKKAFAAGFSSGKNGDGAKRGGGRGELCNHCGKVHFVNMSKEGVRLCWENAAQAALHDFDKMPPVIAISARRIVAKAVAKAAESASPVAATNSAAELRKKVAFMVGNRKLSESEADDILLAIDSGATGGHYLKDARLFPNGIDRSKASSVCVANELRCPSLGQGTAEFECRTVPGGEWITVSLSGAHLMGPPWEENLLSIGMIRQNGGKFICDEEVKLVGPDGTAFGVRVTDLGAGNGEAYHMECRPIPGKHAFLTAGQVPHTRGISKEMHASDAEKLEVWNARFGQISSERMRHLPAMTVGAPKLLASFEARKPGVPSDAKLMANFPRGATLVNKAGPRDGENGRTISGKLPARAC